MSAHVVLVALAAIAGQTGEGDDRYRAVTDRIAAAVDARRKGRHDVAAELLEAYLAQHPHDRRVWLMLGDSYMELKRWEHAVRAFERVLRSHQIDDVQRRAKAGHTLATKRAAVATRFQRIIDSHGWTIAGPNPDDPLWYLDAGGRLERQGRRNAAVDVYSFYLDNRRDDPTVRIRLARILRNMGLKDEAIEQYAKVTEATAPDPAGWREYIELLEGKDDIPAALNAAREAVGKLGDATGFREALARLALRHGDLVEAARQHAVLVECRRGEGPSGDLRKIPERISARISELDAHLMSTPDDLEAADELRRLAVAGGQVQIALDHYHRLLKVHPGHIGLMRKLAFLFNDAGRIKDALRTFERLIQMTQGDLAVRLEYARVLSWSGELDKALEEFEELRTISPHDPQVRLYEAYAWLWSGNEQRARELFDAALAADPSNEELQRQMQRLTKEFDKLLPHAERAYNLNPLDSSATRELAQLYQKLGRLGDARRLYREYMARNSQDVGIAREYARLLAAQKDYSESIRNYIHRLRTSNEDREETLRELANVYLWSKNYVEARRRLGELLDLKPRDTKVLLAMGQAHLWDGAAHDALIYLRRAQALDPGDPDINRSIAEAERISSTYWESGALERCARAAALPRRSARRRPPPDEMDLDDPAALDPRAALSAVAADQGPPVTSCEPRDKGAMSRVKLPKRRPRFYDLLAHHEKTLRGLPDDGYTLLVLADLYYQLKNFERANDLYGRYLEVSPDDDLVTLRMALSYYNEKDHVRASQLFARIPDVAADNPCMAMYRATALFHGDPKRSTGIQEVVRLYQQYLAVDPHTVWVWQTVAQLYIEDKDIGAALRTLATAEKHNPNNRDLLRAKAFVLLRAGRFNEALDTIENGRLDREADAELIISLAAAYENASSSIELQKRGLPLIEAYLSRHGDAHRVRLALARAAAASGRLKEAYEHFGAYTQLLPNDVDGRLEFVGLLNRSKAWERSLEILHDYLEENPDDLKALKAKADVLRVRGKDLDVHRPFILAVYERQMDENPGDVETFVWVAHEYSRLERFQRILDVIERMGRQYDVDTRVRVIHAHALLGLGRHREVVRMLEPHLEGHPEDVDAIALYLEALEASGASNRKLEMWRRRFAKVGPTGGMDGARLLSAARRLRLLGRYDRAIAAFLKYLEGDDVDESVRFELAGAYIDARKVDAAIDILMSLHEEDPDQREYFRTLANAQSWSQKPEVMEQSLVTFTDYFRQFPDDVPTKVSYARVLADLGKPHVAEAAYREVLDKAVDGPTKRNAQLGLLRTLREQQQFDKALTLAAEWVERRPTDPDFRMAHAGLLEATGDSERALESYQALAGQRDADVPEAIKAQASVQAARLEQQIGPQFDVQLQIASDSDDLTAWFGVVSGGYRFANLSTYFGAKYVFTLGSQGADITRPDEVLAAARAAEAETDVTETVIATAGALTLHTLMLEARHRFDATWSLSGRGGVDLLSETAQITPHGELTLGIKISDVVNLQLDGWIRSLAHDIRVKSVLEQGLDGVWGQATLSWAPYPDRLDVRAYYRGGFITDDNFRHQLHLSADLHPIETHTALRIGAKVDFVTFLEPSVFYWDPSNSFDVRLVLGYRYDALETLSFEGVGSLGMFDEGSRDRFTQDINGTQITFPAENSPATVVYSLSLRADYEPVPGFDLSFQYEYGRSGQGLSNTLYDSHTARLSAVVIW